MIDTCKRGTVRPLPDDAGWSYSRRDVPFENDYEWCLWDSERTQLPDDAWYDGPGHQGGFALWPITAASAIIPCIALRRLWRRKRAGKFGLCRLCGYDLRTTPDRWLPPVRCWQIDIGKTA
jgi:hypothetical protein